MWKRSLIGGTRLAAYPVYFRPSYNDADIEVSDTCVRNLRLSWVSPLDVSLNHWTFGPRLWTFRPCLLFYVFVVVFFIWATLPELINLIGWWIDVLSLLPSHCTFTQLHTTLLYFVETSMMKLLMLSKIASIINCLFISCEIVGPNANKFEML